PESEGAESGHSRPGRRALPAGIHRRRHAPGDHRGPGQPGGDRVSNRDTFLTILADVLSELVPEATVDVAPDVLSRPEPNTIRVVVGEVEDEPDGRLTGYDVKIALYGTFDLLPEDARRSKM